MFRTRTTNFLVILDNLNFIMSDLNKIELLSDTVVFIDLKSAHMQYFNLKLYDCPF